GEVPGMTRLHAFLVPLLISRLALAEAPAALVTYPPGDDRITSLKLGAAAPYDGQLFDTNTALRWASWLKQYQALYALDLKASEATCQVKLDYRSDLLKIETDKSQALQFDLKQRLLASEKARVQAEHERDNPGFFKEPAVWFVGGVFLT